MQHSEYPTESTSDASDESEREEAAPSAPSAAPSETCSVCLEDINSDDRHVLSCNHAFHATCLVPWLLRGSATCPTCRSDGTVNPDSELPFLTSEARARYIRRTIARRQSVPPELQRILAFVRREEKKEKEASKKVAEFSRKNRGILSEASKLRRARWRAQRKVIEARRLLGSFDCDSLRLPGLSITRFS